MKYSNSIPLIFAVLLLSGCSLGEEEKRLTQLFQDKAQENKTLQEKLQQAKNTVKQLNTKMIEQDIVISEHQISLKKHAATQAQLKQATADMVQQAEQMELVNRNNKKLEQENLSLKEELTDSLAQVSDITKKLAAEDLKMTTLLESIGQQEDENKDLLEQLNNKETELQEQIQLQQKTINDMTKQSNSKKAPINDLTDSPEKQKAAESGQ